MTIVSGVIWEKNCFWSGQEFFGEYRYATNEELIGKFDITIVVFLFVEQKKEFLDQKTQGSTEYLFL